MRMVSRIGAVLAASVILSGCASGGSGSRRPSPASEPARSAGAPTSPAPARAVASRGSRGSAPSVSRMVRDGERCFGGQLERVGTRVTSGPPAWHCHLIIRNVGGRRIAFEYRIRFHDGSGREHRQYGSLKWKREQLDSAGEKELIDEMPWVRVNTIAFEVRPVAAEEKK